MIPKHLIHATLVALATATPALADIVIEDAYFRTATPNAKTGAAFMVIRNTGDEGDRLLGAETSIARRVELHTHKAGDNGVMQMLHVEEGFEVPAGGVHELARGGDHIMMMGLTEAIPDGSIVSITLTFEKAGARVVEVPVDRERGDSH